MCIEPIGDDKILSVPMINGTGARLNIPKVSPPQSDHSDSLHGKQA